ncbi:MAG: exonuclease domain-containing protein [Pseudomonadota bacterium]
MTVKIKLALAVAVMGLIGAGTVAALWGMLWSHLQAAEKEALLQMVSARADVLFFTGLAVLAALFLLARTLIQPFVIAPRALAEDVRVMLNANPQHRAAARGPAELRELAAVVNQLADAKEALRRNVEARIAEAKASLEEEKNRLAALMSELAQGVVVCNIEGQVLLYNSRARQLLGGQGSGTAAHGFLGLGRSIFGVFDRGVITHALDTIHDRLARQDEHAISRFVTAAECGPLVRITMVPVLDRESRMTGFVLTMEDVTEAVEAVGQRDALLTELAEGNRASLANVRAAVETLEAYPDMDAARQKRFIGIIGEETARLSQRIEQALARYADSLKAQWRLEEMAATDFVAAAVRRMADRIGIPVMADEVPEDLWLRVDNHALVQCLTYLGRRLKEEFQVPRVRLGASVSGRHACLDLRWPGLVVSTETVNAWQEEPLTMGGETSPLSVRDVVQRHGGEIWYQREKASQTGYIRFLLPMAEAARTRLAIRIASQSRPEYYDFDLFHQPGQTPELDDRPLAELAYTVFDTETTGLEPSAGDEIISIGALRIVNGRLLRHEAFEQLIDPRRPMSRESIAITGIQPAMLQGQPTIDRVLPAFHRFCEDTVLVAHNAAFDMRFLQLKEQATGVRFTQPVLDTLLLSAVIHPNQNAHKLEAIAERLGINIIGRHTALGDAIVTGEVFLRMIPLLAEKGIRTLRQAREAAERTYYARVKY